MLNEAAPDPDLCHKIKERCVVHKRFLSLITLIGLTACGGQLPVFHKAYQPPQPEQCRDLDLGPGVHEYGEVIKLSKEERSWLKKIKSVAPDGVKISPRLIRLSRLMLELKYRGCDTDEPELRGDLFSHVGMYSHINQIKIRWFFSEAHPDMIVPKALSMIKRVDAREYLSIGGIIRKGWTVGSAAHLIKYNADIDLKPTPRVIKKKVRYHGKILGERSAQALYVTLPNGSVQRCNFQRDSREEHPLIKCTRHPEDYQLIDAEFSCGVPGRYQIEFTAQHRDLGPTPVANFRVWCGESPPRLLSGQPLIKSENLVSVQQGEADFIKWMNQARLKAGLAPLKHDPELSVVARKYSNVRKQLRCGGHRCGGTTLGERITNAGLESIRFSENASNALSPQSAHQGLMDSPAHRSATLSKWPTRYGVGVAIKKPKHKGQKPFYYVTELYQSPTLDRTAEGCELYLREKLMPDLPHVSYSAEYAASAKTLVDELAMLNEISAETKNRVLNNTGEELTYYLYKGMKSYGHVHLRKLVDSLKRTGSTQVGIGCSRSTRGHQERWFVVVRDQRAPVTRAGCESYLTQKLRQRLPHLKRSEGLVGQSEEMAKMLARAPAATSKEIRAYAKAQGVHYTYFKNRYQPKAVSINKLAQSLKQWSSSEVSVTCLKNPKHKSKWHVAVVYDERPTSVIQCQDFLRDKVQRGFRRVKPSLAMTQVSAKIAELISAPELNKNQQRQVIKDHFDEPKYYRLWTHVERPQTIKLDKYIQDLKGRHSTEFGVTCRDNAPEDPHRSDWTVVLHHNQSEMSDRACESYLTEKITQNRPELMLNPRMAQTSNKIVSYLIDRSLSKADREAKIQAALSDEKLHLKWEGISPRKIPIKELLGAVKRSNAREFALSCSKYGEEDERRWAIVIHYR